MTETSEPTHPKQPSVVRRFGSHLFNMPRWHKLVLSLAVVFGGAGLMGHVARLTGSNQQAVAAPDPAPGKRVVADDAPRATEQPNESWLARHAPALTRVGMGCIAGFIIGWLFRAFIKLMSMLTLAGAALFAALSYFNVMNVDFTAAKKNYDSSIAWVSDQAGRAKDGLLSHIPASGSSIFGMFLGFRRRK